MRLGASRAIRGLSTKNADLLPPLKVAVTGAAGQIGYALVMRIARYVFSILQLFALQSQCDVCMSALIAKRMRR